MSNHLRQAIHQAYRQNEKDNISALATELANTPYDRARATETARNLITAVRTQRNHASGVDHLMHEFSLSSHEGVALMCLAEALLRIPDHATADHLIRDKIGHGNWSAHLGNSHSLFVNAAAWGLMLTGKLLTTHNHAVLSEALDRILVRSGEPLIRRGIDFAMRLLGQHFVMGEHIETALKRSQTNEANGYSHSFDMLGEAALTEADAERYCGAYEHAIHVTGVANAGRGVVAGPGISVKLSALHPRYTRSQRTRVMNELLPRLKHLAALSMHYDIGLTIDAEEADRLELSLDLLEALTHDPHLAGWHGLGFAVQAYQKRSPFVVDRLIDLARNTGHRLMIRLVKGAYWDSEIKRTQVDGLIDYPVYTRKPHSDIAYLVCAKRLLAAPDAIYPQFATHNAFTIATVQEMATARKISDYEFQCLHGMGEPIYDNIVNNAPPDASTESTTRCRIYAPVGTHKTLLPYLVRRLLENGANSSFVNQIVTPSISIDTLVTDPLTTYKYAEGLPHPAIPLPRDLFGTARTNAQGIDLSDEITLAGLESISSETRSWHAAPLVDGLNNGPETTQELRNPANRTSQTGTVIEADTHCVTLALENAADCTRSWHATPPPTRAAALLRAADLLEAHRPQLLSLCIREAGKTWPNAIGELREAVDYCRYYAQQIVSPHFQNANEPPGPVACISPWNFPLAIFIGEIAAALAAGSPVIAKPAEQTPLTAHLAVRLLHQAGIPPKALQLLPGPGETTGAQLVADARIQGIIFTGSTEVARLINQCIAQRENVRLIAETGGQNAMIVDSSALAEQVVQDALLSAFDSAGQRCSSLRILCLQNDIADHTISLLKAAMRELSSGDPALLSTDIGPVIDDEAKNNLLAHIEHMRNRGYPVFQHPLPAQCSAGCFVAPTLIEIDTLAVLQREIFGPILHVLRFDAAHLPELIDAINATGYGLTLGIHSRIDETIDQIVTRAHVGNIYINRNMIGAVVGVQPFGGEGLSGTGPKAGGPLYLHRLSNREKVTPAMLGAAETGNLENAPLPLQRLEQWATQNQHQWLAERCREYAATSLLTTRINLPGPTGETNTLTFAPRGRMLCTALDENQWLNQLAAIHATGNRAVMHDTPDTTKLRTQLPPELAADIDLCAAGDYARIAGILIDGNENLILKQRLSTEPGALIPIYPTGKTHPHYPLYRMLIERVRSENTTAAGGNTTLMMLST